MNPLDDIEKLIHTSYEIIRKSEHICLDGGRPEERANRARVIAEQWALLDGYLDDYRGICHNLNKPVPEHIQQLIVLAQVHHARAGGAAAVPITISEDGQPLATAETMLPPRHEFNAEFLEELTAPGGTVKLRDKLYVRRAADAQLEHEIVKRGAIITIRAPRQTGKSSLLVRGIQHARTQNARVVALDMQLVDKEHLSTSDSFLRCLAETITRKLRLAPATVEKAWRGALGAQDKLTYFMEDYVLSAAAPLVLTMDEADILLDTTFHNDFFALIRAWHNRAAYEEIWDSLTIVLVISTEPYLLISDVTQSPFNVGLKLHLRDFDAAQIRDLNQRHGAPINDGDFALFMALLGGHPYLTRQALYTMCVEGITWAELDRGAARDDGPFGDHLRRQIWLLRAEPELRAALQEVVRHNHCADDEAFYRLLRAGLVIGNGKECACRCELYQRYFAEKL